MREADPRNTRLSLAKRLEAVIIFNLTEDNGPYTHLCGKLYIDLENVIYLNEFVWRFISVTNGRLQGSTN